MPFWDKKVKKEQRKCDRCGRPIVSGSPVSNSTAITNADTGENLCTECMIKMVASFTPDNEDTPDARVLVTKATGEVAHRTGLPNHAFRVQCKGFIGSDVEISVKGAYYDLKWFKFITDLDPAVDYVIQWIKEHPLPSHIMATIRTDSEVLEGKNRFAFFFVPARVPVPQPAFVQEFLNNILPMTQFHERNWRIVVLPDGSDLEKLAFMQGNFTKWIATQRNRERVLIDQKVITFENKDQITCIIAYLKENE